MIIWINSSNKYPQTLVNDIDMLNKSLIPSNWQKVHSSPFAQVASNSQYAMFHKVFLPRNYWEAPKSWLRGSRAQRAIKQSISLPLDGFNTPSVICWGKLGSLGREFMATEAVNGIGSGSCLTSYFRKCTNKTNLYWKRVFITEMGKLVGNLHAKGIVHGDLRPNNILMELGKQPFTFHLIDNERNKQYKKVPYKLIIKNLVQIGMLSDIDLSNTDRMRFYKSYLKHYPRFTKQETIILATQVYSTTMHRLSTKTANRLGSPDLPNEHLKNGLIYPLL